MSFGRNPFSFRDNFHEQKRFFQNDIPFTFANVNTYVVLALILFVMAGAARSQSSFEERKDRLLAVVSQEPHKDFFIITAKLRTGVEIPRALSMFDSLTADESMGGMFYACYLIGTYLHMRDLLPDSLHRKIRRAYRQRMMVRGDTENHWVMYYTGLYLAAQTWPNEEGTQWFNGKSSEENFKEAEAWLNYWIKLTATKGQGEFDSPTYFITFVTPVLVLYDFAQDPVMKKKAQMMLDYLFADFAAEHLRGNYGGGHSRDYPQDIINPITALSTKWAWLYFGEPDFEPWSETRGKSRHRSWETVFGAVGSYRLPDLIRQIATDRSAPYVHTETKRVRNIIRFGAQRNPPVYKYTYMTSDYVLGSLHGGILQPIQQHTWDVTFVSDKPYNTIFTLHPFYSGKELAMFFPEEQKILSDEVDRFHLVYTNPNKWNSSSPYEQTFQHKNALIVLYNIDPHAKHSHIDGFFPKTLEERVEDASRWIFCKAGKTYIAFYPLKPYEWIEEEVNWRWRSHDLKNGIVVEIGTETDYGSFAEFKKRFQQTKIEYQDFDTNLTVKYTTQEGAVMQFTYGGPRLLNGKPVDFASYKSFNGPFLQSEAGSGVVKMTYKNQTRILDFNRITIEEKTNEK
ncbi:MAG: hypothetical protein ONB45_17200 [candidate division KSB1 bacterium]|nr:hypothetical protein [candidate division KSB1 bacterium]